jgi:hypothetical protein
LRAALEPLLGDRARRLELARAARRRATAELSPAATTRGLRQTYADILRS